jgi:hypothetical protein
MSINHATEAIRNKAGTDGDIGAKVIRLDATGPKDTDCVIVHELGRIPVGMHIIKKNKAVDMYIIAENKNRVVVRFTEDNCDVNIRMW